MTKILFVCTENIFRSASAEFLFKKLLHEYNSDKYEVFSAGVRAKDRGGMYSWTRERIKEYGGDPSTHIQERVTKRMLDEMDVVICMTQDHGNFIKQNFGVDSYLFNELTIGKKTDLEDDVENDSYTDLASFVYHTVDTIYERLPLLFERLEKMNL